MLVNNLLLDSLYDSGLSKLRFAISFLLKGEN